MKIHNYDTTLEELKPCPFCGGQPVAHLQGNDYTPKRFIAIECKKCNIVMTHGAIRQTTEWLENICIEAWNKRRMSV